MRHGQGADERYRDRQRQGALGIDAAICGSGLASRMGRKAAPVFGTISEIAGAALQPIRDARPLPQKPLALTTRNVYAQVAFGT
ncbi:hypothetical protein DBL05_11635 [Pseudomonas putida]|nr:hypothetical protein DBL05_11635 [Pseudomonas putida]